MGTKPAEVESYTGPLYVIIIGAGAGGLSIAQGLKKNGISFSVFDKEDSTGRVRDWGMTYMWASTFIPDLLPQSIIDKLPTAEFDYPLAGPQGAVHDYTLFPPPPPTRPPGRVDVQYSKTLVSISYPPSGVVAHFSDGTSSSGSLIIGADGGQSRVRHLLLGDAAEPTALPMTMNNFNVSYTAEQALFIRKNLDRLTDYGVHPKGFFFLMAIQSVPDTDDPSTWLFQLLSSWPDTLYALKEEENTSEGRLKVLKGLTKDFSEPRKSAIEWVKEGTHISRDRLAIWSPVPWDHHRGRVTLAGDAAHAMTYHRGQGLNNCFNDAANLVKAIVKVRDGEVDIEEAVNRYREEVVDRGQAEVEMRRRQTMAVHDWGLFMESPIMKMGVAAVRSPPEKGS
ncbi:related to monooxygenase [Phialocephala subalpina]|uniref:Related to monooxygenase n=1 Tax=Phialocephala subalpina TaxID=576137 RepID=A0A1L7XD46_9HELO|nr:related to monooxygenase [Phialocephala subalpina]